MHMEKNMEVTRKNCAALAATITGPGRSGAKRLPPNNTSKGFFAAIKKKMTARTA
jgi:hypothetical protein